MVVHFWPKWRPSPPHAPSLQKLWIRLWKIFQNGGNMGGRMNVTEEWNLTERNVESRTIETCRTAGAYTDDIRFCWRVTGSVAVQCGYRSRLDIQRFFRQPELLEEETKMRRLESELRREKNERETNTIPHCLAENKMAVKQKWAEKNDKHELHLKMLLDDDDDIVVICENFWRPHCKKNTTFSKFQRSTRGKQNWTRAK